VSQTFIKNKEDFVCEHCGTAVQGDGFTNHCPECLWSKHVDKNPGDRQAECGGMMRPIDVELEKQEYILTHQCEKCGYTKRNKTSPDDNYYFTASFNAFAARNFGTRIAGTSTISPVRGLRALRALRCFAEKIPRPAIETSSPFLRECRQCFNHCLNCLLSLNFCSAEFA
jgi:hypothetical protein